MKSDGVTLFRIINFGSWGGGGGEHERRTNKKKKKTTNGSEKVASFSLTIPTCFVFMKFRYVHHHH